MILLQCLKTVRPALLLPGVPTQSFVLRGASPKVRELSRTTPVAYELASDTCYGLGVVTAMKEESKIRFVQMAIEAEQGTEGDGLDF